MPQAAISEGGVDFVLPSAGIAHALITLLMAPGAGDWFRVEKLPAILSGNLATLLYQATLNPPQESNFRCETWRNAAAAAKRTAMAMFAAA
jgi:hypothetical protein